MAHSVREARGLWSWDFSLKMRVPVLRSKSKDPRPKTQSPKSKDPTMRSARSLNSQRPAGGDKRAAIIRAAIRVFAHNGYFNSKVADIAREAGVADGTVYLYFKSKEEILHSIFDRTVDEAVADARKQLDAISDPREKLRKI